MYYFNFVKESIYKILILQNRQQRILGTGFEPVISRMKILRPRPTRRTEHQF